jgi:CheY-like chemotaxis protein
LVPSYSVPSTATSPPDSTPSLASDAAAGRPAPHPLRILLLEDVLMDAELVEYELERARIPFVARRVDTREGFLRALEEFEPDLILSDFTLPRFDGMAALALARERAPSVPFLIVTGSVNEETAVGCMKAGPPITSSRTTSPGSGRRSRARWRGSGPVPRRPGRRRRSSAPRRTSAPSSTTVSRPSS